jgi:long-chain acyl-CoA synthetase
VSDHGAFPVVVTAAESERDQRRAAASLQRHGLTPGDRVAIVAPSSAAYLAVAIGALRTGIVPVLLNPALTPGEQRDLLADADAALVLRGTELAALVATAQAEVDLAPHPRARPMLFTSGTTGRPKGVWSGVLAEDDAAALINEEAELWGFAQDDTLLVVSPLHHSAPLRFSIGTLLAGGQVVLCGGTAAMPEAIARHRPTTAFVAPVHLRRLCALGDDLPPLASFRLVAHAGAPCAHSLKRWALDAFPSGAVWEFYGSTEGQFTACSPEEWSDVPGTVGRARPGRRLEVDRDGTIWCRAPRHARFTYWRDRAKTAEAWRDDAFTVGDVGRLDAEGYLFLDGRRDDLIISGGVNVYPVEVERAILTHPDVTDAMVFGIEDDQWGQMVCAAIVGNVGARLLDEYLRGRIAAYKRPKRIVVVDELPHTPTGKLSRSRGGELLDLARPDD